MRITAAILLEGAIVGLIIACQRPAFGADEIPLKLRLSRVLTEGPVANTSAGAVGELPQQVGATGKLSLRLSEWFDMPALPDDDGEGAPELAKAALPENRRLTESTKDVPTQGGSPEKDGKKAVGSPGILGMGLAPIRWGGYTTDNFRVSQSTEHPTVIDHSQRLDLRASSYLWQPWFAVMSGGLGMSRGLLDAGDTTGESKSTSVTGFGDLTLFPQSRFPFSAAFSVSDSSTSTSLTTDDQTNKRYSLRQTYRPAEGNSNYTASYQNSTMTSKLNGDDVVEAWQGSYSTSIGNQRIGLEADRTETSRSQNSEGLLLDTVTARHSYSPGPSLTIDTNARLSDSTLRLRNLRGISATGVSINTARYLQAGSYATWRPRENLPLNVTAGVNLFTAQSAINDLSTESQTMNANLGATYSPTRNLTLGASGTVVATKAGDGPTNIITTENANAGYSGDPLMFGKFSYNWNVSGTASNQTEEDTGSTQALSAAVSHGLNREYRLNEQSTLNFSVNQSLSNYWAGESGQYRNLSHNGSVSWQVMPSDSMSGSVNLSATDTRTMGSQESENQFVSVQGNGRVQLSSYASASANVGLQWNRQGARKDEAGSGANRSINTTGSISYQHTRAFGVNNLRYSLLANLNMQRTNARLLGDVNADTNPIGYSLEQHLDYRIGRIDLGLTGTVAVQDGRENALLFFHIGRSFGNY